MKYFDRVAYLAQSPQFYKEHGVAGFERAFETGYVCRAEPHATSRHLTEYYSRDLELGFLDGPEDVIQLERELLTHIFDCVSKNYSNLLSLYCVSLWRRTPVSPPFSCSDFHCRGARSPQLREER